MAQNKILTDVAGTAVHDGIIGQLMGHFARQGTDYLKGDQASAKAKEIVAGIRDKFGFPGTAEVVGFVHGQLSARALNPDYLKLTGETSPSGYESGAIVPQGFDDVIPAFKGWHDNGRGVWTYSNGSAEEQEAMLSNTSAGDMTPYVRSFFDTADVGLKTESDSYKTVADRIQVGPSEITFLSDRVDELDAAYNAGLDVVQVNRPGNKPQPDRDYKIVTSFADVA